MPTKKACSRSGALNTEVQRVVQSEFGRLAAPGVKFSVANRVSQRSNIRSQNPILRERAYMLPDDRVRLSNVSGRLQRLPVIQSLCGAEQFDGEQAFGVRDCLFELERSRHAHGNVIFFAA